MNTGIEGVSVPKSIAAQGEAAEDLIRQRTQPEETGKEPGPNADPDQTVDPQSDSKDKETQNQDPEQPDDPNAQKQDPPAQDDSWEQRYKALQGKYNAEVPRLYKQVKLLTDEIAAFSKSNDELRKQVTDLEATKGQEAQKTDWLKDGEDLDPEDFEGYGADVVRMAKGHNAMRKANLDLQREIKELRDSFAQQKQAPPAQQQQKQQQEPESASDQEFFGYVERNVPGWDVQNNDPDFINWLKGNVEPISGLTYYEMLQQTHGEGNAHGAAQIFLKFRQDTGKDYSQHQQPGGQKPPAKSDSGENPKRQPVPKPSVAPPKSRGGNPEPQVGKEYTQAEIKEFYDDCAKGKYSDDEISRIEKDIFKAKREGRIR